MKPSKEQDVLKESIALMETKLAKKLILANKKSVSKNEEIEINSKDLILVNNNSACNTKKEEFLRRN